MQNKSGLRYSAMLHGILLLLMIFGLPEFLTPKRDPEPSASTDRILTVSLVSNVPIENKTLDKPKPTATEEPPKTIKPKVETRPDKVTPPPPPPPPKPVPPKPAPPKPKVDTPKPKEKPKPKEESLDDILKGVEKSAKTEQATKPTQSSTASEHTSKSDRPYTPGQPMSLSELDGIKQQIGKCWITPAGANSTKDLTVTVHAEYAEDGSLIKAELPNTGGRYLTDSTFRAASDAALRAVKRCTPLKNLPADKFETWRIQDQTFNPKDYQ